MGRLIQHYCRDVRRQTTFALLRAKLGQALRLLGLVHHVCVSEAEVQSHVGEAE